MLMLYLCFQNDTSQNNNGCGSLAFAFQQSADVSGTILDSNSK